MSCEGQYGTNTATNQLDAVIELGIVTINLTRSHPPLSLKTDRLLCDVALGENHNRMRDKEVLKEERRCRLHFPASSVVRQKFCRNLDVSDGGGLDSDSARRGTVCEGCLTCDMHSEDHCYYVLDQGRRWAYVLLQCSF